MLNTLRSLFSRKKAASNDGTEVVRHSIECDYETARVLLRYAMSRDRVEDDLVAKLGLPPGYLEASSVTLRSDGTCTSDLFLFVGKGGSEVG